MSDLSVLNGIFTLFTSHDKNLSDGVELLVVVYSKAISILLYTRRLKDIMLNPTFSTPRFLAVRNNMPSIACDFNVSKQHTLTTQLKTAASGALKTDRCIIQ
jgi:hypothetical protein